MEHGQNDSALDITMNDNDSRGYASDAMLRLMYDNWEGSGGSACYSRNFITHVEKRADGRFDVYATGRDKTVVGATEKSTTNPELPLLIFNDETGNARRILLTTVDDETTAISVARWIASYYSRDARIDREKVLNKKTGAESWRAARDSRGNYRPISGTTSDYDYLKDMSERAPIAYDALCKRAWPVFGMMRRQGVARYVGDTPQPSERQTKVSASTRAAMSKLLAGMSPDVLKLLSDEQRAEMERLAGISK